MVINVMNVFSDIFFIVCLHFDPFSQYYRALYIVSVGVCNTWGFSEELFPLLPYFRSKTTGGTRRLTSFFFYWKY